MLLHHPTATPQGTVTSWSIDVLNIGKLLVLQRHTSIRGFRLLGFTLTAFRLAGLG
jgi:hypothetical protein